MNDLLDRRRVGLFATPRSNPARVGWIWAADNGCFSDSWDLETWCAWLDRQPRAGCLFGAVPDVVADARRTLERFTLYADELARRRYPLALVAQDGLENLVVPWGEIDALFVGGSMEWKWSNAAEALAREARARGKWVHVGRINSARRYGAWLGVAHSCDGTFVAYAPRRNIRRLVRWLEHHDRNPQLRLA